MKLVKEVKDMNKKQKKIAYIGIRMLEVVFIAMFILGIMWSGANVLNLTVPQFLMLYGAVGAGTCEVTAQGLKRSADFGEEDE